MKRLRIEKAFGRNYVTSLAFVVLLSLGAILYAARVAENPPGYYIDESSISYNAHTIAQTGRDEHGVSFPLFFRAFGDYKNPVYIYLLAALFRVTGPSILVARLLSVALGVAAAGLLGLLALRLSKRRGVALLITMTTLLTPWFFELSRVVLEVALYPAALALFLLCVHRASRKAAWSWTDACALAATLALLTYAYSIGRLFAPLLALGLALFTTRARLPGLLRTWLLYAASLLPLFVFQRRAPGALTGRFSIITYITPQSTYTEIMWEFVKHYAGNLNLWRLLVAGDPNVDQIVHIYGTGHMLLATALVTAGGAWLVLRRHRSEAWWRFIFYGLAVSIIPAALTKEYFHMLRLAASPVFLIVLSVPALMWLYEGAGRMRRARRAMLAALVLLSVLQGALFQRRYHASARTPRRLHLFDADYPGRILPAALAHPSRPIYLADALAIPGYIQAYWYATLGRIPLETFTRLPADAPPPVGALVVTTEENCPRCRVIESSEPYTLYIADAPARVRAPLSASAFRAEINVVEPPSTLDAGEQATIRVRVRNAGDAVWPARERSGGQYQVSLGNHWLDAGGRVLSNDDGRRALLSDLRPGEETELSLVVNAPGKAGEYLLELDMLQEGVTWFGPIGSPTTRLRVRVD